jgi:hypothetical protein
LGFWGAGCILIRPVPPAAASSSGGAALLHIPLTPVVCIVLGSLDLQVLGFGIGVWMMRFRSTGLQALVAFLTILPMTALFLPQAFERPSVLLDTSLIGCALAAIGVWLTWIAYHRWLEMEIG